MNPSVTKKLAEIIDANQLLARELRASDEPLTAAIGAGTTSLDAACESAVAAIDKETRKVVARIVDDLVMVIRREMGALQRTLAAVSHPLEVQQRTLMRVVDAHHATLGLLKDLTQNGRPAVSAPPPAPPPVLSRARPASAIPLDQLEVSVRTYNCLKNAGLTSAGAIASLSERDLLRLKNMGRRSVNEIKELLHDMGLSLHEQKRRR